MFFSSSRAFFTKGSFSISRDSMSAWTCINRSFSSGDRFRFSVRSPFCVFSSQIKIFINAVVSGCVSDWVSLNFSSLSRDM